VRQTHQTIHAGATFDLLVPELPEVIPFRRMAA
jgi:hypothetical protein